MRYPAETKRLAKQMNIPLVCANRMAVLNHEIGELLAEMGVKGIDEMQKLLHMSWQDFHDDRNISKLLVSLELTVRKLVKRKDKGKAIH